MIVKAPGYDVKQKNELKTSFYLRNLHMILLLASEIKVNAERSVSIITAVGTRGHAVVSPTSHQDQIAVH